MRNNVVKESNPERSLRINEVESSSQATKSERKPSKEVFSEKLIQYLTNQEFNEKLMNFGIIYNCFYFIFRKKFKF